MSEMLLTLEELRKHLRFMISLEKQSGDFLLASVVQDCLVYHLQAMAKHPELPRIAHAVSELAVVTAVEGMGPDPSTVSQTVRGVLHGLANVGVDPLMAVISVTTGAQKALGGQPDALATAAIVQGLAHAGEEMGIRLNIREVGAHLIWCISGDTGCDASQAG